MYINALISALTFLTILPSGTARPFEPRCLAFFPLVGLMIGLIASVSLGIDNALLAALVFVTMVSILTGGLHLDGFADTLDALAASHKASNDRAQLFLQIAAEPTCGPIAVTGLNLLLIGKISAVSVLGAEHIPSILFALCGARLLPQMLMHQYRYARKSGFATSLIHASRLPSSWLLGLSPILLLAFFTPWTHIVLGIALIISVLALHAVLINKSIGGYTGDTIGAAIEVSELLLLLGFAMVVL